jgi:hypothetical protein
MKSPVVLIVLGLAVAFTLLLIYVIYGYNQIFHVRSTSSNSRATELPTSRPISAAYPSSSQPAEPPISRPISISQIGVGTGLSARPMSAVDKSKLYLKLTESSDPEMRQLFDDCFRLIDRGNYREARLKLNAFMDFKSPFENKFMAPGFWLVQWCRLNEGEKKDLLDAAAGFSAYAKLWTDSAEYKELTKAALINSALIYVEASFTALEKQSEYSQYATEALNSFLAKWPDDPQASEARTLLESLNGFHPQP